MARLFEAFSRRDLESTLELVHPEVVFEPRTAAVTRAGEPYRGPEGIRRYAQDVESHWEVLTVHPAQIRSAGRAVVALGLVSGRGPAGAFQDAPTTWVVRFKDDLVAHVQIFSDERYVVSALVGENGDHIRATLALPKRGRSPLTSIPVRPASPSRRQRREARLPRLRRLTRRVPRERRAHPRTGEHLARTPDPRDAARENAEPAPESRGEQPVRAEPSDGRNTLRGCTQAGASQ